MQRARKTERLTNRSSFTMNRLPNAAAGLGAALPRGVVSPRSSHAAHRVNGLVNQVTGSGFDPVRNDRYVRAG